MKRIFGLMLFFALPAVAQYQPVGAFIYSGSAWAAATSTSSTGASTFVPPVMAQLYCYNSSLSQWVPATSLCFGGGGTGTVTSVAMTGDGTIFNSTVPGSPITTSGTLAPALLTQTANTVLAGPTSAGPSAPTFRALVAADMPSGYFANPMTTLGDTMYGGASGVVNRLAGPTVAGTYALGEVATGSSVAPAWINFATPPAIGGTTPAAGSFTTGSFTGNVSATSGSPTMEFAKYGSVSSTTNTVYQGGLDATSSSNLGSGTFRGANNPGTGAGGNAILQAGASTSGQQGWANVQQSFTTGSALASTFNVVSMTSTADQVSATGLGALTGVVGIAQTVGGTGTQVWAVSNGKTTVRFDGTPVIGDTACAPPPSTGTAGLAHDNGTTACTTSSLIGVVTGQVSGTGSGATATVLLKLN